MHVEIDPKIQLLDKRQLSQAQGVSITTINVWMRDRIIPFFKVRGLVRFDLEKVRRALSTYEVKEVQPTEGRR